MNHAPILSFALFFQIGPPVRVICPPRPLHHDAMKCTRLYGQVESVALAPPYSRDPPADVTRARSLPATPGAPRSAPCGNSRWFCRNRSRPAARIRDLERGVHDATALVSDQEPIGMRSQVTAPSTGRSGAPRSSDTPSDAVGQLRPHRAKSRAQLGQARAIWGLWGLRPRSRGWRVQPSV